MAGDSPYRLNEGSFVQGDFSEIFDVDRRGQSRSSRSHYNRGSPHMNRRPSRPRRVKTTSTYYDVPRYSRASTRRDRSADYTGDGRSQARDGGSACHSRSASRNIPRMLSFSRRSSHSGAWASGGMNPRYASGSHARMSPKPPPLPPAAMHSSRAASEKHAPLPYDDIYNRVFGSDMEEELEETARAQRIKRIVKYSIYALIAFILVLTSALMGYFLTARTPTVALHAVNTLEGPGKKFKLQGSKMQFHIELTVQVYNENYFEATFDDFKSIVFWPDTKFALGSGRVGNIKVPARRTAEITMPIGISYDVKHGPSPVLLGLVDSCGLNDAGNGEVNLEVEIQSEYHTKMKQGGIQTGRQSISVKCPVRRMGTIQVGDGTTGTIGDLVRTLNS